MSHRIALLTTLAACSFAAALPAAAGAATHVSLGDPIVAGRSLPDALIYEPDDAEAVHVELSQTATDLVVTATSAIALDVAAPCVGDSPTVARCPLAVARTFRLDGEVPTAPVVLTAAPGVTVDMYAYGSPGNADTLVGGAGDDQLDGGSADPLGVMPAVLAADTVDGGAGDDQLFVGGAGTADGGPGDDVVQARERDDLATMHGGDGDDSLWDAAVADGGAGDDEIVRTLEADGGEGDDVLLAHRGTGGPGDDHLGSFGPGSILDGGEGDDSIGSSDPGTVAHGGPGNDLMEESLGDDQGSLLAGDDGDDTFTGWGFGATFDGGPGNDTMGLTIGGRPPGALGNTYYGGPGADQIEARNTYADRIDCGDDVDTVRREPFDIVIGCENDPDAPVVRPLPLPVRPKVQTAIIPLAFRGTTHFTVTTKGTVHLGVRCPRGVTCAGRLRLAAGKVVLGAVTCAVKGDKTVTLKLNRAALKLLRKRKHHTLTATLSLTPGKLTAAPKPRRITLRLPTRH
ncbi:MAG TPA: calcium-binding protein [Baekduia sp.]